MKFSFFQIYSTNRIRVSATFRKFQQLSESFRKFKNAEVTVRKFQNISDFLRKFQQLSDFEPLAELPSILRNVICMNKQIKYYMIVLGVLRCTTVQDTPGLGTAYNAAERKVIRTRCEVQR